MTTWTRHELLDAFHAHEDRVRACVATGDWSSYVESYTPDVHYIEHVYGTMDGHEAVGQWIQRTMTSFPGSEMTGFPATWVSVDVEKGWIIAEVDNPMRDPGDGSHHAMGNISIFRYAGDGKFREQEDIYNPMEFFAMAAEYARTCAAHGTLTPQARTWAAKFGVELPG